MDLEVRRTTGALSSEETSKGSRELLSGPRVLQSTRGPFRAAASDGSPVIRSPWSGRLCAEALFDPGCCVPGLAGSSERCKWWAIRPSSVVALAPVLGATPGDQLGP